MNVFRIEIDQSRAKPFVVVSDRQASSGSDRREYGSYATEEQAQRRLKQVVTSAAAPEPENA